MVQHSLRNLFLKVLPQPLYKLAIPLRRRSYRTLSCAKRGIKGYTAVLPTMAQVVSPARSAKWRARRADVSLIWIQCRSNMLDWSRGRYGFRNRRRGRSEEHTSELQS